MNTIIMTDSSSDLPYSFIKENDITFVSLICHFEGKDYKDDFGKTLNYEKFYRSVRAGEIPTTSQVNVQTYTDEFKQYAKQGKSIIYLCFSSALSGCIQSAFLAKNIVLEEYKDADITIIDTKSASLGQGLLVYYSYKMLKKGSTKDDIVSWLENNKLKMNHWFTVDSLDHLKRGGRISSAAAIVGNILNIKPILNINNAGKLAPVAKVQGRKKSIRYLADILDERIVNPRQQVIAISHGDCPDDANYLKNLLNERNTFKNIIMNHVGPVIGSHSGPGTLALFFLGAER